MLTVAQYVTIHKYLYIYIYAVKTGKAINYEQEHTKSGKRSNAR